MRITMKHLKGVITTALLALLMSGAASAATVTIGENSTDDYSGTVTIRLKQNNFTPSTDIAINKFGASDWEHTIFKFTGLSSLPAGLTVTSARLRLYVFDSGFSAGNHVFTSRRMLRDAVVGQAFWTDYATSTAWTTAGAQSDGNDRVATPIGTSENVPLTTGVYYDYIQDSADFRAYIEDIVDGVYPNYGFIVERSDGSADSTYRGVTQTGGTDGQRPYLEVTYTTGSSPLLKILQMSSLAPANDAAYSIPPMLARSYP